MMNKHTSFHRRQLVAAGAVAAVLLATAALAAWYAGASPASQAADSPKPDAPPKENKEGQPKKPRVLVIVAHADDMEYDMGGFVAQLVDEGHEVYRVAVTDSARGTFDRSMTIEKMKKIGEDEAEAAGKVLGLKGNIFLGFPDGMIGPHEDAIAEKLMQVIRRLKPGIVILFDPWATQDDHPDHAVAARAARWASEFAVFPLMHPEQLKEQGVEPHWVAERYYFSKKPLAEAKHVVDVTKYLDKRIESLLKYESQMRLAYDGFITYQKTIGVPRAKWPKQVSEDNYQKVLAATIRRDANLVARQYQAKCEYAEVYRYVKNEPRYP